MEDDKEVMNVIDSIIRNSPISVSVADPSLPDNPLIAVSKNFESLSGFARQDILGRNCRLLNEGCHVDPEVRRSLNEVCRDSTGKAVFGGKLTNRRKDGSTFTNILRLRSIFLGGRRLVVGIQLDEAHAAVSKRDVQELETAVQRRGVLAKWMWSKAPSPASQPALEEEDSQPGSHVVQRVSVVTQPRLLTPDHHIEDSLVILVAYRLSASVITGMGEGAVAARVCQTVAEARLAAATYREESRLLCGELNSQKAEGFDLGLNPRDYVKELAHRPHRPTLVVSGSNVPRAIAWARRARILVLGSFLNFSALIELIVQQQPMPVVLLCAGQDRAEHPCEEHEIFCGYLLHALLRTVRQPAMLLLSETARQAMQKIDPDDPWLSARRQFFKAPRTSALCSKADGFRDVNFCLKVDRYARILPWYSPFLRVFVRRRARKLLELLGPLAPPVPSKVPEQATELPKDRVPNTVPSPEKRNTVRLFLVRHGEYEGEFVKGMAGTLDPRLTEQGVRQAQGVSELLASEPLEILLFSPMVRTMQTAEIIARPHKDRGLAPEMNRMIAAVNRGDWSGLTPQQVEEHFPGDLERWQSDPDFKDNGGESFNELMERTQRMLEYVLMLAKARLRRVQGPVAACLVGHSSTVASVVSLMERGPANGVRWTGVSTRLKYCSVTLVEFDDDDRLGGGPVQGRMVYVGQVPYSTVREAPRAVAVPAPFVPGLVLENGQGPAAAARAAGGRAAQGAPAARQELLQDQRLPPTTYSQVSIVTLPGDISPEHEIESRLVVLIDALRMSSTLVTAMGQGLESAQLFSSVMEVTHAVRGWGSCALLGGEQRRVLIPGFDRDNSPRSYLDGVTEKTALFLTTNGTRALPWVRRSKMLVLGSFLNASAVIRTILAHLKDVTGVVFLCSGTERGTVRSQDDELCAGYLLKTLLSSHSRPSSLILDEAAVSVLQKMYVLDSWEAVCDSFHETPAAEELRKIQLAGDVEFCLQRDRYRDMLPFYEHGLDIFFSHQVHYNLPVRYEAVKRFRPSQGITCGDAGMIQVYIVLQDEEWDAFEAERVGPTGYLGEAEAARRHRELVRSFAQADVAFVACSPAQCCRAAAEGVARSCGSERAVEIYGGLAAVNSGDWAGLSPREVRENFPGSLERWHEDPDSRDHGGESLREVYSRAVSTFRAMLDSYVARGCSGAVVMITHSTLALAILAEARRTKLEKLAEAWRTNASQQGSVTLVEVSVPADAGREATTFRESLPEGCRFRVTNVGRGVVPMAPSSGVSRL